MGSLKVRQSLLPAVTLFMVVISASARAESSRSDASYFLINGNPVAAKYLSGTLVRIPTQDAETIEAIVGLEAVAALSRAQELAVLSHPKGGKVSLSPPRGPQYGEAMFDVSVAGVSMRGLQATTLVWSGSKPFREVELEASKLDARIKQSLITDSRRLLMPVVDFREDPSVKRRLRISGPVSVRELGRPAEARHLAYVSIAWRIEDIPDSLANNGIDSLSPILRVDFMVNTNTGKVIYRHWSNSGESQSPGIRLFKEPGGPLLMATNIECSDGAEPFVLDLERETYGVDRDTDVPPNDHCFPAQ